MSQALAADAEAWRDDMRAEQSDSWKATRRVMAYSSSDIVKTLAAAKQQTEFELEHFTAELNAAVNIARATAAKQQNADQREMAATILTIKMLPVGMAADYATANTINNIMQTVSATAMAAQSAALGGSQLIRAAEWQKAAGDAAKAIGDWWKYKPRAFGVSLHDVVSFAETVGRVVVQVVLNIANGITDFLVDFVDFLAFGVCKTANWFGANLTYEATPKIDYSTGVFIQLPSWANYLTKELGYQLPGFLVPVGRLTGMAARGLRLTGGVVIRVGGTAVTHTGGMAKVAVTCAGGVAKIAKNVVEAVVWVKHHSLPKFLGGNAKQLLSKVNSRLHDEFHRVLRANLREAGFPLNVGGRGGSTKDWKRYFQDNPGSQRRAFAVVLKTSRFMDARYGKSLMKDGGSLAKDVLQRLRNGNFTLY